MVAVIFAESTKGIDTITLKVPEGAVVEDLMKRLPGIEVDTEGKITTATGKTVRRVFVDGKEFFGNDPKMATKNLNVDMVDKIQVIEKQSDLAILTGVEDDDSETNALTSYFLLSFSYRMRSMNAGGRGRMGRQDRNME